MSKRDTTKLSGKHQKTLQDVFDSPARAGVKWRDVENLMRALGAEMSEGRGSRVRVYLKGVRAVFHRPHPTPEIDKGALRSVRRFLSAAGVKPHD